MVDQLSQSGVMPSGLQFTYGAEHQRIKMCTPADLMGWTAPAPGISVP